MTSYRYTGKDQTSYTGTLQQIGETLISEYADDCTDNSRPWETWPEHANQPSPREFTVTEWVAFIAILEDRHPKHVTNDLTQTS